MKTLIIGGGVSGKAALELASTLREEAQIVSDGEVTDMRQVFDAVDQVVVSPGVKPWSPLLQRAEELHLSVISEMEYGFRHFNGKVLGITGTNGKTTTTELTTFLLNELGIPAVACGNIGLPLAAVAAGQRRGETAAGMVAVAEVSSFQLEHVDLFAPFAALCLNLASDHIDRYRGGFAEYCAVKLGIFKRVAPENRCYGLSFGAEPRRMTPDGERILWKGSEVLDTAKTQLRGRHNLENLCGALELVSRLTVGDELFSPELKAAATRFKVGRHRLETVCERDGIRFIDDSKATNPASVVAALTSLGEAPVRLILGGLDKGMDFSELLPAMESVAAVYLIGETEAKLHEMLHGKFTCRRFGRDFPACVKAACAEAVKGDVVLLSPSCASMDMFRDYKERGEIFSALCRT